MEATKYPFSETSQGRQKGDTCRSRLRSLLLAATLSSPTLSAEESSPSIDYLTPLDGPQQAISRSVSEFANWLDSFFGENRIFEENRGSYLKLDLLHIIEEGLAARQDQQLKARILLPTTRERLKLVFESEPEEGRSEADTSAPLENLNSPQQSVGLRYTYDDRETWQRSASTGIRFRSSRLDPFLRLRFNRLYPMKTWPDWSLRASQSFFWYDSSGAGESTRLDLEHIFESDNLFRSSSIATWLNNNRYFELSQEFSVFHQLDSRRAVVYQAAAYGQSKPDPQFNNYVLAVRYRKQVHRDWLFLEVTPGIRYPRENDFNAIKSLSFKLEILFGRQ